MSGKTDCIELKETSKKIISHAPAASTQSSGESTALKTNEVVRTHLDEQVQKKKSPNFAYETVLFGLKALEKKDMNAKAVSGEIEAMQQKWDAILQFQQTIAKLPSDKAAHPITEEMRKGLQQLKAFGIDVIPEDAKEISADKLITLKSEIDARKSKVQTDIQIKTVGINLLMQHSQSLIESLKNIVTQDARVKSTIINKR